MTDEVDLPTLPHSLTESVELLDRFSFNPRLPSFFELPDYKEFLEHDFPAPSISSITSKANQAQFPAFFYPSALVEFAYSDSLEVEEITRESGLSLYFSAETLRTIFRPFSPDQTKGDSFPLTEAQTQEIFDAAEPYLQYIARAWLRKVNCPLFVLDILAYAEQQARESLLAMLSYDDAMLGTVFPQVPIPFSIRSREGDAIFRIRKGDPDIDPFLPLRSHREVGKDQPRLTSHDSVRDNSASSSVTLPITKAKKESKSVLFTQSTSSPNISISPMPAKAEALKVSSSTVSPTRGSRNQPARKAKNNHSVLHARSVDPPDDGVVHRSEASQVVKSGFKRRKVSVDTRTPSNMDRVEDILRGQSSEIEPSIALGARLSHVSPGRGSRGRPAGGAKKKDQTSSSTHIDYKRGQSVKMEHDNIADDVKNGTKKHKNKVISNRTAELEGSRVSDEYIPTARPLLLVDPKGHLVLPDLTGPEMEELDGIDHNGEPFRRNSLLFELDETLLNLGTKLTAQNTHFNFADLVTVSRTIRLPTIHDQACISLLSAEDSDTTDIELPLDSKCQRCQQGSKLCLLANQLSTVIPAMNNIFAVSGNHSDSLGLMLQRLDDLLRHMELIESSYAQTRTIFLQTMENLQTAGADPITVLEALRLGEPERRSISVEEMTMLATLFNWSSLLNFRKLDTAVGRSTAEWLQLLRKLHSGETTLDNEGNEISSDVVSSSITPKSKLSE
ncbi:hypothetical protein C8J55DRAFT_561988 [Lentinula edodes]|uniref:Uncharacterized protein n=1 Tax=Lentinula lateritia TaxID=40482 RepID=A0A9W9DMB5_9AGAR|nr:hypothetical protein C8J55DRAFT_561988 [Lentinula edodes]